MAAPRQAGQGGDWLDSGFPPRSFPPGGAPPPVAVVAPARRRGRGRWLAAAAILVALLLLAGGLLLANRDGGGGRTVAAGTSSSDAATGVPAFDSSTTVAVTPPSIEPVSSTATSAATTIATGPAPGVLEASATALSLPKTDATVGVSRGTLTLRNAGASALTYAASSNSPGLSAAPPRGTIGPGASATVTVTLDATQLREGPFTGTLTFAGSGGSRGVQVQSTVGRPPDIFDGVGEACAPPSPSCSRQIKLAPTTAADASPCNTPWVYSVLIKDESQIQSARANARRGVANADAPLQRGGTSEIFLSEPMAPLGTGITLRFVMEAVDQYGYGRRLAEQTITCA